MTVSIQGVAGVSVGRSIFKPPANIGVRSDTGVSIVERGFAVPVVENVVAVAVEEADVALG